MLCKQEAKSVKNNFCIRYRNSIYCIYSGGAYVSLMNIFNTVACEHACDFRIKIKAF